MTIFVEEFKLCSSSLRIFLHYSFELEVSCVRRIQHIYCQVTIQTENVSCYKYKLSKGRNFWGSEHYRTGWVKAQHRSFRNRDVELLVP